MLALGNRDFQKEFHFSASRSSGPGGQNVNKVSSKVELKFHVLGSEILEDDEKSIITQKLKNKINAAGFLIIVSQSKRTQLANKNNCVEKFIALLIKTLSKPTKRYPTKPSYTSVNKRLNEKKRLAEKKANRLNKDFD